MLLVSNYIDKIIVTKFFIVFYTFPKFREKKIVEYYFISHDLNINIATSIVFIFNRVI